MISLHKKYNDVVNEHFGKSQYFQTAIMKSFQAIVNRNVGEFSNAELMSSFCDRILKPGEKTSAEEVSLHHSSTLNYNQLHPLLYSTKH